MSGGSVRKKEFSLLGREREIKELERTLKEKRAAQAALEDRCETQRKSILMAELQADAFREELHAEEIALTKHEEKLEIILRDMENGHGRQTRLAEELQALEENLQDLAQEKARALALQSELRERFPYMLELVGKSIESEEGSSSLSVEELEQMDETDIMIKFMAESHNCQPTQGQIELFRKILEECQKEVELG